MSKHVCFELSSYRKCFGLRCLGMSQNNPLTLRNAELNPICHLLALLGAHHILHVGTIRVKVANKSGRNMSPNKLII